MIDVQVKLLNQSHPNTHFSLVIHETILVISDVLRMMNSSEEKWIFKLELYWWNRQLINTVKAQSIQERIKVKY